MYLRIQYLGYIDKCISNHKALGEVSTKMRYLTFKCLLVPIICKRSGKLFVLRRQMSHTTPVKSTPGSQTGDSIPLQSYCRNQTSWECSRNTFVSSFGDAPGRISGLYRNLGHIGYIGNGGREPCGILTCVVRSRLHGGCVRSRRHLDFPVQRPIMPRAG